MRIFLDTNIYILGADSRQSNEGRILTWLGFHQNTSSANEVIVSEALIDEIARVAKRLRNKDWSGELLSKIYSNLNIRYVLIDRQLFATLEAQAVIPREDIGVYLTAQSGKADYFVSANHKLIRALVRETEEFECFTPETFVSKHVR